MAETETRSSKRLDVNSPEFLAAQGEIAKRIVAGDADPFRASEQGAAQAVADASEEDDAPSSPGL